MLRLAPAPFGSCAVWLLRRLAPAPFGFRAVWLLRAVLVSDPLFICGLFWISKAKPAGAGRGAPTDFTPFPFLIEDMPSGMDSLEQITASLGGRYRVDRELGVGGMATVY